MFYDVYVTLCRKIGKSPSAVAKELQINKSNVSNWKNNGYTPRGETLNRIADYFGVSTDFLLGKDGNLFGVLDFDSASKVLAEDINNKLANSGLNEDEWAHIEQYRFLDKHGKDVVDSVLHLEYQRIEQAAQPAPDPEPEENIIRFPMPFYLQPSSAGFGDWADSEYAEKVMLVKEPPFGAAFIIPVNGDSMEPTYPDGCKVFVRPQHEVREGQVGIFYMDGKLWIKELGDGELLSHNPDYPPQPFQEDLRCWGLVVGICDDSYFEH